MADWIKPGAEVVVYQSGRDDRLVCRTTVGKVASKSFLVDGIEDRFSLADLETKNIGAGYIGWRYRVTQVGSDRHLVLEYKARVESAKAKAAHAAEAARRGYFVDVDAIGKAAKALAELHTLLSPETA